MQKRTLKRYAPLIVAAAATALVLVGCSAPGATTTAKASTKGPIKIALVDAQSGQSSSLGGWELQGVNLAIKQANAAGGIDGRKIQLTVYDDTGDPTIGTNLATKISTDGNIFMFGTAESAVSLAMAPILKTEGIPFITSGTSPAMPALNDPMLFLNSPSSTVFDDSLAKYIKAKGDTKVAMISNNGAYGSGEHNAFLAALGSNKPLTDQIVTPTQTDFSAALQAIRATNPQIVFIGAEEVESGLIAKQARQLGIKATFAGSSPMSTPLFVNTAGKDAASGSIVATPYFGNDYNAQTKKFAKDFQAEYSVAPELHGAKAYDGANIVIQALKNSKVATGQKLADAIRAVKYKGLVGDFAFDSSGLGVHSVHIGLIDSSGALVPQADAK
ncbi:MAG TPA: ABC transporter substrate-binding protein [Galbitalea sp.]